MIEAKAINIWPQGVSKPRRGLEVYVTAMHTISCVQITCIVCIHMAVVRVSVNVRVKVKVRFRVRVNVSA